MRIVWNDYVNTQLAWWSSLSKLARDPSIVDREYISAKALSAFANARAVSDAPVYRRRAPLQTPPGL